METERDRRRAMRAETAQERSTFPGHGVTLSLRTALCGFETCAKEARGAGEAMLMMKTAEKDIKHQLV